MTPPEPNSGPLAGADRVQIARRSLWSARVTALLAGSMGLLVLMSLLAAGSISVLSTRADWVAHTERVRFEISQILRLIDDVESAARGFALSADPEFLVPYRAAIPALETDLAELGRLVLDNDRQADFAGRLQRLAHEEIAWTGQSNDAVRSGHVAEARQRLAGTDGKHTLDTLRDVAAQMTAEEDRLLDIRRAEGSRARRTSEWALCTVGALAVFLLWFVAWMTLREQRRVQRAEAELATTLRSIGDGVISTDPLGNVRFMNAIAERLTGWPDTEARGLPLAAVFQIVNEQTRAAVENPVSKVMREGAIVGLANHTVLVRRDGGEAPIEDSGAPIRDAAGKLSGVVLVFRDATDQRKTESRLLESEERFRGAVAAIQGVLWTNTAEGEMRGEQPAWAALTGQRTEDYQGFGWAQAVHPDDAQPTIDAWIEAVAERRPFEFEHRLRRHDGQWRNYAVRAIPLFDAAGRIREWVGVHTDITEQRQASIELREASARKDVFLATLSHELRNPLAPIRTSALLLESGKLSAEQAAGSHVVISRQVRHMASLLDDLLDISRITRGVLAIKPEPTSLHAILEAAVEAVQPSIDAKGHALELDWPGEAVEVRADPVRLTQVATNLLANASKYTNPGGSITFRVTVEADSLLMCVRDSGIGIASDKLHEVFEMFAQVHPHTERSEGGLGIGLALVKGLVELHGGRIEARSEGLDRGSEFRVYLPRTLLASPASPVPAPQAPPLRVTTPRRLLIADDNRDGAESLAMLLELSGHNVLLAHSGIDAMRQCEELRPEIAILDIGMPGLNGYEVAARIRATAWGARMTLIAVTGYGGETDKLMAQGAGFDHHLTKPMDPDLLARLIDL